MVHRVLRILCVLAAFGTQAPAQGNDPAAGAPSVVAVEKAPSDESIAARLRGIFSALDHDGITVSVEAGVVTLTGEIADQGVNEDMADIARRIEGVVAVNNALAASDDVSQQINPALERFSERFNQLIARLPLFAVAAGAFVAIVALGTLLARSRFWDRIAPNVFIAGIYRQAFRVAAATVGIVVALDLVGAAALLGTILGAAGIVGLAIGFAVRDTVENFVASIMLSLRQPFRPNDLVEIAGDVGRVIRLTSRATILLSLDGNHIRIPNATVFKGRIVNYTQNPARRFSFDIGIDPDADLEATRQLAQSALKAQPFVLGDPEELVWIENITESGAILRVTGWIDQNETGFVTARGDAIRLVKAAIEAAGVAIPDTTYRIRLEGAGNASDIAERTQQSARSTPPLRSESTARSDRQSEEQALIPLVAAEREESGDLLAKDAPRE
ncbi:mechanosensitive ion channel MscS [Roseivivax marinus]|uniref:Small-conductance mechanosensitive channel n=1 Tax=Roseivivax marinus TaxID=1379903 RepID=W4HEU3_9RHOB|nr:mechanosensitive ion channel family protein [Roseivivax marinus]ETW10666.1 mechanosensitive ion channel MscS [Roseivivax marinus]